MATRSKLADFEVISRLGSGSFGTVFKVKRHIDESLYVIKNVRIVELSFKEQSEAINEVQILAQLKSPYVVRYYDSFIEKDCLHIVMEFCNRGDLQNLIRKAKDKSVAGLKENVIWNISLQIMLGLYYLHKKHVLHRDLKSANVFLMKDETKSHYLVKIGDLGVAKLMDTSTALANTIVGTPYYLSPELCADMPYRDKSDCWAMGVLIYECATLQHPFEARNQCALIMKIIEAQVKIPAGTIISIELRNLILWLLQKDPNLRPSVKDILNESSIRDKLAEHQFELPEELLESRVTDILSNANFENKEINNKKGSSLHLLAQRTTPDEAKTTDNKEVKKPVVKRENTVKEPVRVGEGIGAGGGVPVSPSAGMKGGVRRTGSTTANLELKHDNSQQQLGQQQGLSVAGNGVGPRTGSTTNVTSASPQGNIGRAPPSFRGPSPTAGTGGADGAGIRGDRVRGGAIKGRVPSEKAMNRYQVRPPPGSNQGSGKQLSDSKLLADVDEHQSKDAGSSKSSPNDPDGVDDSPDARATPRRAASHHTVTSPGTQEAHSNNINAADAKDTSDYEDEEFEEYDGDNNWDQTQAESEDSPQFSTSAAKNGASRVGIAAAGEKPQRRDSQDATISRHNMGMKDHWEYNEDGEDGDKYSAPARHAPSTSFRSTRGAQGAPASNPFHDTDGSLSISDQSSHVSSHAHTGTMNGEADMWSPVWTQNRGVIDKPQSRQNSDVHGTSTADIGANMYRETLHQTDDLYGEGEDMPRNSELSEDGFEIENLLELIEGAKSRAMGILGKSLFWKVYELCAKHMHEDDLPTDRADNASPTSNPFVQELEEILCEEGSGSIEVACEGVFSIKLLLALESKYEAYVNR